MLGTCLIGSSIIQRDVVTSTMDEARHLLESGGGEGTVVVAEKQIAGRGRFNRQWVTHEGQDLALSIILYPQTTQLPQINMAATLAVSNTVDKIGDLHSEIKWPNDVQVNGKKVAGILVESVGRKGNHNDMILGIGINVNADTSSNPELSSTSTSLAIENNRHNDRTEVLVSLIQNLDQLYQDVSDGLLLNDIWARKISTLGQNVKINTGDRIIEGLAKKVNVYGNLVVELQNGIETTVASGDVTLKLDK